MQNENNTRKFDVSFPRQIAVVVILSALLSAYPLFAFASAEVVRACIAGVTISLANVLAGYAAIEYSIDKSYTVFLKAGTRRNGASYVGDARSAADVNRGVPFFTPYLSLFL